MLIKDRYNFREIKTLLLEQDIDETITNKIINKIEKPYNIIRLYGHSINEIKTALLSLTKQGFYSTNESEFILDEIKKTRDLSYVIKEKNAHDLNDYMKNQSDGSFNEQSMIMEMEKIKKEMKKKKEELFLSNLSKTEYENYIANKEQKKTEQKKQKSNQLVSILISATIIIILLFVAIMFPSETKLTIEKYWHLIISGNPIYFAYLIVFFILYFIILLKTLGYFSSLDISLYFKPFIPVLLITFIAIFASFALGLFSAGLYKNIAGQLVTGKIRFFMFFNVLYSISPIIILFIPIKKYYDS